MPAATTLAEDLLPVFDVSDSVGRQVQAPPGTAWEALLDVDLIALGGRRPLIGLLGGVRIAPELVVRMVRGRGMPPRPSSLSLRDMAAGDGDWIPLGERPGEEIALGLIGRFWKPVIEYRRVDPGRFEAFAEPGWAKTVYSLSAAPLPDGSTLLTGTMRTATTDARARKWFRRYWTLGVGAGARLLVDGLLAEAAAAAERRTAG